MCVGICLIECVSVTTTMADSERAWSKGAANGFANGSSFYGHLSSASVSSGLAFMTICVCVLVCVCLCLMSRYLLPWPFNLWVQQIRGPGRLSLA